MTVKYYRLDEIEDGGKADTYTDGKKTYMLSWGHSISAPGPNGTTLWNTDIEGVIEAASDEEAATKFGVTKVE